MRPSEAAGGEPGLFATRAFKPNEWITMYVPLALALTLTLTLTPNPTLAPAPDPNPDPSP